MTTSVEVAAFSHFLARFKELREQKIVSVVLEKRFYIRIEKIAEKLGTKPDIIINLTSLINLKVFI